MWPLQLGVCYILCLWVFQDSDTVASKKMLLTERSAFILPPKDSVASLWKLSLRQPPGDEHSLTQPAGADLEQGKQLRAAGVKAGNHSRLWSSLLIGLKTLQHIKLNQHRELGVPSHDGTSNATY